MKEIRGDIWDYHKQGHWIVITTNGNVKENGEAVMGGGPKSIALQAAKRFPDLPCLVGALIKKEGNHVFMGYSHYLLTFPVKHNWWEKADLALIERSTKELYTLWMEESKGGLGGKEEVYMVRPGCGNGRLDWKDVKPILEKYLDDRFIVVERNP